MGDDKQLVSQYKQGIADALAAIYDRYAGLLVKVAGGLLNERGAAEDVVHDTFVNFAQSGWNLTIQGSLKAYLITCATNGVRDILSKKVLKNTRVRAIGTIRICLRRATPA